MQLLSNGRCVSGRPEQVYELPNACCVAVDLEDLQRHAIRELLKVGISCKLPHEVASALSKSQALVRSGEGWH